MSRSEGLDHVEGASTRFMVASGGVLSEGYGHGGPGVCLGDSQTEAEGRKVPSQSGRGDALLQRMHPNLTSISLIGAEYSRLFKRIHSSEFPHVDFDMQLRAAHLLTENIHVYAHTRNVIKVPELHKKTESLVGISNI